MSRRIPLRAAILLLLLCIAIPVGWAIRSKRQQVHHDQSYTAKRSAMVQANAAIAPPQDFVALGDSLTEQVYLADVCGRSFNAGVGGARVADVAVMADRILKRLQPKVILVAVGTNDFWTGMDVATFRTQYAALLARLPRAHIILMGLPESAEGTAAIREMAKARGFTYVDPVTGPGNTVDDGAHLKSPGARLYRQRIAVACAAVQPSSPPPVQPAI